MVMTRRTRFATLASVYAAAIILAAPHVVRAQTTGWGDPDLQGIWSNQSPVPVERPAALAGKATFTKEEAAEFERTALTRLLGQVTDEAPFSGELSAIWLETANGKVAPSRATSLVVEPADGRIPYTPEGRQRWDSVPRQGMPMTANRPEDRPQTERCL